MSSVSSKKAWSYFLSSSDRTNLAKAMIEPIKTRRDYFSLSRRILSVVCMKCNLTRAEGAEAGCPECIIWVVLES